MGRLAHTLRFSLTVAAAAYMALFAGACKKKKAGDCTSHATTVCEADVAYWVDSCGEREELFEQCECGCDAAGIACEICLDPCNWITCDEPPPQMCIDEQTLRQYHGGGVCVDGRCVYNDFTDSPCTDCCYGAEINFTGDPLGGGVGYSSILTPQQADVVVDNTDDLLTALSAAQAGEVIYIDDGAEIDLTGHDDIIVPAGVTVASGRGLNGSRGALLYTTQFDTFPLFRADGAAVRFTGVRIRGPDPEIGDHDYNTPVLSRGIQTVHADLEVDNCELSGFGHAAVVVSTVDGSTYVHHNYIHNSRRAGLGYGVVLNQSWALIEGNIFDGCRHSIAGTGRPGTGYEARYNVVLVHANGHAFDMHGAADFDKRISSAIWRFNEGQGDTAADTSVYHSNDCTLTNMDTATCWVAGHIETALRFDGVDDYLECGTDTSLQSQTGTVEFWFQTDVLGQDMELFKMFEDADSNYLLIRRDASNRIAVVIEDNGTLQVDVTADPAVTDTSFHHVIVMQDGNGVAVYLDGQPLTVTGTNSTFWTDHLALAGTWIGAGHTSNFNGVLDEVRIYSRELDQEEIDRHFNDQADIAGGTIHIHHNTFRLSDVPAVVVRGVPSDVAHIHHNWFHDTRTDYAVRQSNAQGNWVVENNHYGTGTPLGTILPVVRGRCAPAFGTAPLPVTCDASGTYDPGGAVADWHWNFGDGSEAWGERVSHTFDAPGRYMVQLTVFDDNGVLDSNLIPVEAAPPTTGYFLDFWVKDSYRGTLTNYYRKQAFIDGQLVWEDDVEGDEGWVHVHQDVTGLVSGQDTVTLTFRVEAVNAVTPAEIIELDVFFDDVILFGGLMEHGDFETAGVWSYSETGANWSGRAYTGDALTGSRSYRINHPYNRSSTAGTYGQVEQTVPIKPEDLRGHWPFDDGTGPTARDLSVANNHGTLTDMAEDQAWVSGVMSRALRFDGFDDVVVCGPDPDLSSPRGTISLWLQADSSGQERTIIKIFEDEQDSYLELLLTDENRFRLVVMDNGAESLNILSPTAISDAEFHHLAAVQDGSAARIYLDGADTQAGGANSGSWTDGITVNAVWIGGGHTSSFQGILDEVRIYTRDLSAAEIDEQHREGFALAVWAFDDGQGDIATDSSIYGNHGTLTDMDTTAAWVAGKIGTALAFDGVDDYVSCGSDPSLTAPRGTVEFWIRPSVFGEQMDIINIFQDGYENYLLIRKDTSDRIYVRIEELDQGVVSISSDRTIPDDAEFHHVAVTQSGLGVKIFIDGEESGTSGTNSDYWTDHLILTGAWIGAGHWSQYTGAIDEVRIHPRALRPDEILDRASQ